MARTRLLRKRLHIVRTEPRDAAPILDQAPNDAFSPWATGILLKLFLFRLNTPGWGVGLMLLCGYWGLPLIACMIDGTLLSVGGTHVAIHPDPKTIEQALLAIFTKHADGDPIPYLDDRSHLLFSPVLALGAGFASVFVRKLHATFNNLTNEQLPNSDFKKIHRVYGKYRKIANHWGGRIASLVIAVPVLIFFVSLHFDKRFEYWWGSSAHGSAGLLFAANEFLMVYYGTQGLLLLTCAVLMISSVFKDDINLQPYHPDGCNGLLPIGELILYIWLSSIVFAGAIFVATYYGYLGLESTPVVWLLATLGTVAIPVIAILPLKAVAKAVSRAQYRALAQLSPALNRRLLVASIDALADPEPADKDRATRMLEAYRTLREINIWPFSPRALSVLTAIYAVQVFMVTSKLIESVRDL